MTKNPIYKFQSIDEKTEIIRRLNLLGIYLSSYAVYANRFIPIYIYLKDGYLQYAGKNLTKQQQTYVKCNSARHFIEYVEENKQKNQNVFLDFETTSLNLVNGFFVVGCG